MSTFLGFISPLMSLGATVQQMQTTIASALIGYGWQCRRQALNPSSVMETSTLVSYASAVDGDNSTKAGTMGVTSAWVGVIMPAVFTPTAMYITCNTDAASAFVLDAPLSFNLDYWNGSAWATLVGWSGQTNWEPGERRKFTVAGAGAYTQWRLNVLTSNGPNMYVVDWTLEDSSSPMNWVTTSNFADFIPPVSETIGNANSRDVVRLVYSADGTTMNVIGVQEILKATPQVFSLDTFTAGAVTISITLTNTVSFTGVSSNTALQNARGLYEACRNSANADFLLWNWYWPVATQAIEGAGNIFMSKKTPSSNVNAPMVVNCAIRHRAGYCAPMVQTGNIMQLSPTALTVDLVNGFVYYLQICSRGLAFGIKTNSGYYGAVHACYTDNASALAQLPTADLPGSYCSPIELLVGYDDVVTHGSSNGSVSHVWAIAGGTIIPPATQPPEGSTSIGNYFMKYAAAGQIQDVQYSSSNAGILGQFNVVLSAEGINGIANYGQYSLLSYPVNHMSSAGGILNTDFFGSSSGSSSSGSLFAPAFPNLDWYKYVGVSAPASEQLILSPSADFVGVVNGNHTAAATTINVTCASGVVFPAGSPGYIIIDGEPISYTGVTNAGPGGSTSAFTGCTRGLYGTTAQGLPSGTPINIGGWFCVINTSLLFAGYQRPV
jgi:hypothetical protein